MKFSIGDKIVMKRTGEEGRVVAIVNKKMVEVEVAGTVFPVYNDDVDHPYLKWFTEKKSVQKKSAMPVQLPVEKLPATTRRMAKGAYLSFIPEFRTDDMEEMVSHVKVFLLNELPVNIRFVYDVRMAERSLFRLEGGLHAFGNIYLHSIPYAEMNDQPRFNWTLTAPDETMAEGIVRIKPAKLFEHITSIQQGNEPSFSYLLAAELKEKKKPEPMYEQPVAIGPSKTIGQSKHTAEQPRYELDLHIEQLRSNSKGLSNAEIIKIQLDTLERYLHLAIMHRLERMIVIHGLGKGKLRDEVHAMLKATPEVGRYKNEWSGRYGFGATEVTFRY
ncbi:hypothetical protein GCM10023093_22270 [Nemorincola caseinilytica]|uniref:Smr domain-containing protein n=1 Tax=Nemorincola caseinilytica TaxID=2054315 RepID=A0ABP8NIS3_9BACT